MEQEKERLLSHADEMEQTKNEAEKKFEEAEKEMTDKVQNLERIVQAAFNEY